MIFVYDILNVHCSPRSVCAPNRFLFCLDFLFGLYVCALSFSEVLDELVFNLLWNCMINDFRVVSITFGASFTRLRFCSFHKKCRRQQLSLCPSQPHVVRQKMHAINWKILIFNLMVNYVILTFLDFDWRWHSTVAASGVSMTNIIIRLQFSWTKNVLSRTWLNSIHAAMRSLVCHTKSD